MEEGEEPNLPDKLDVTVAIKENKEGEESTTTGAGISNVVQAVGEIVQLPKGNTTISGLTWDTASSSQSNNRITDTYVPVLPETDEYGNTLVLMNAMTQVPVIQATRSVVQNDQDNTTNDIGSAGSENDIAVYADNVDTSVSGFRQQANGVTIYGQEGTVIWSTDANRFELSKGGNYLVTGEFDLEDDKKQSTDPLIIIKEGGTYNIILENLEIDLTDTAYSMVLSIPSGAIVNLTASVGGGNKVVSLGNSVGGFRRVVSNDGTLNLARTTVDFIGEFENQGTMTMKEGSVLRVSGPTTNAGTMTISDSSKMGTFNFTNDGSLEINGKWEKEGRDDASTLTVQGRFWNSGGKKVIINEGGLYVDEGVTEKRMEQKIG